MLQKAVALAAIMTTLVLTGCDPGPNTFTKLGLTPSMATAAFVSSITEVAK